MSECYVKQVSFKKFFESIFVSSELNADIVGVDSN